MISAGQHVFEFEGEILELEADYLILRAKHGDIYIERKYLVFIQYLNEEQEEREPPPPPVAAKSPRVDNAAKFIKSRLRQDPLEERLVEKLIPPSQYADDEWDEAYVLSDSEDTEVAKNILSAIHGQQSPAKATNLRQAIKEAMSTEEDFSMGGGNVEYKSPLQTILGMANAGTKKNRDS